VKKFVKDSDANIVKNGGKQPPNPPPPPTVSTKPPARPSGDEVGLRHAYVQLGERWPIHRSRMLHVAEREDGTGLDVWWLGYGHEGES
jgi:hypothetical protein